MAIKPLDTSYFDSGRAIGDALEKSESARGRDAYVFCVARFAPGQGNAILVTISKRKLRFRLATKERIDVGFLGANLIVTFENAEIDLSDGLSPLRARRAVAPQSITREQRTTSEHGGKFAGTIKAGIGLVSFAPSVEGDLIAQAAIGEHKSHTSTTKTEEVIVTYEVIDTGDSNRLEVSLRESNPQSSRESLEGELVKNQALCYLKSQAGISTIQAKVETVFEPQDIDVLVAPSRYGRTDSPQRQLLLRVLINKLIHSEVIPQRRNIDMPTQMRVR